MGVLKDIQNFLACILQESCKYSIKKILAYTFSALIIYLAVYTEKNYYELLVFVGVLVGVRTYERIQSWKNPELPDEPGDPEAGINVDVDMKFGKSKRPSKKRILTD